MPSIAQLLTTHPAGCVVLHGASGASIFVDYKSHVGTPTRLADVLLAWDLLGDDAAHTPVPPTPEGIALLGDDLERYILNAIIDHATKHATGYAIGHATRKGGV